MPHPETITLKGFHGDEINAYFAEAGGHIEKRPALDRLKHAKEQ
jgi:hypothetical protein